MIQHVQLWGRLALVMLAIALLGGMTSERGLRTAYAAISADDRLYRDDDEKRERRSRNDDNRDARKTGEEEDEDEGDEDEAFTDAFRLDTCTFTSTGRNTYFVLEPGFQLMFEGRADGLKKGLTATVLNKTKRVAGVETRIIEERHTEDGELVELSLNYVAICKETSSVIYFGEDVDNYEKGVVVNHNGSWLAGQNGARAGVLMPGMPLLGARYYQEVAPGVAMDRAEIESISEVVRTPAGRFERCLKTEETTPLEPTVKDVKLYAPGIGLVQDGPIKLVRYGNRP